MAVVPAGVAIAGVPTMAWAANTVGLEPAAEAVDLDARGALMMLVGLVLLGWLFVVEHHRGSARTRRRSGTKRPSGLPPQA
ncbi:hypothetical protein [Occultella gossypii]|uniref:Uncharacterized protein n=1 Tax=Occultella gossypii TaxID=2800820 RepID=A0ABS7SBW7_9MICO|nr:hypothetical protein [Occultella gossypii]MBZ2196751.1 hypothetical protein [Occultella gossypii]